MLASPPAGQETGTAPAYPRALAWWAVAVTAVFQIFSLIDRMIVAVLIPEMRVDLELNDFQISLV